MNHDRTRRALVTGGASGIGRAIVDRAAAAGMAVVTADIDVERAEAHARQLAPAPVVARRVDVADNDSVDELAAWVDATGGVDLLVCNAGVAALKPLLDTVDADWEWILDINLMGAVRTIRALLPGMIASANDHPRHIVCVASMSSLRPGRLPGTTMYCASKFALLGMCESLRAELEPHGIGLTVVLPGPVATDLRATSERLRPGIATVPVAAGRQAARAEPPLPPERVADIVFDAIAAGRTHVATHPDLWPEVDAVQRRVRDAFR